MHSSRTGPIADSAFLINEWLPEELSSSIFDLLVNEVNFVQMHNFNTPVPRLVAVQHQSSSSGDIPIYRHPTDSSPKSTPFSETVADLVQRCNQVLGTSLNHALIQLYRSGSDSISEHSDKSLDLRPGSLIVNASFGASRTMTLRYKANKDMSLSDPNRRVNESVELKHGSLLCMPLECNAAWTHAIRRTAPVQPLLAAAPPSDASHSPPATRHDNDPCRARISVTLREVSTFITPDAMKIYGSGAINQERVQAGRVDPSDEGWSALVRCFGKENKGREVKWEEYYGSGSDALR